VNWHEPARFQPGQCGSTSVAVFSPNRAGLPTATAQAAGLTLSEIRAIVEIRNDGTAPCTHVDALLVAKLADIERRRQELAALEADLTRLVDRSRMLDPADCTRGDICHILQPATIGRSKNPATGSGFGVGT
jgi:hypothetical protein